MRHLKTRVIAAAAAVMMFTGALTGCSAGAKNLSLDQYGQAVAATMGEEKIYLDEVNFYVRNAQYTIEMMQAMYFGSNPTVEYWEQDYGNGRKVGEIQKDDALARIRQERILIAHAADYNVSLSEADVALIEENAAKFTDTMDAGLLAAVNTEEEFVKGMLTRNALANRVYQAMVADVDQNVADELLGQRKISYIMTTEATAEAGSTTPEAQAQAIVARINGGEDIEAIAVDLGLTVGTKGFYSDQYTDALGMVCENLAVGETAVAEETDGWYAMICTDVNDMTDAETKRSQLISEREAERFAELYAGLQEASPKLEVDSAVMSNIKYAKVLYAVPVSEPAIEESSQVEAGEAETSAADTAAAGTTTAETTVAPTTAAQ